MTTRYLKFIIPLIGVLFAIHSFAQNTTTLTGQVVDTSTQVWGFSTWVARLNNPSGGTPVFISGGNVPLSYTGQLDATGNFTSGSVVANNAKILPTGTTWSFTLYSLTSAPPSIITQPIRITGTTFPIGVILSAGLPPPIVPSSNLSYAYNTSEVANPVNGNGFTNTLTNKAFLYNNGWVPISGSGCTGSSVTGNVAFNNQVGAFQGGCLASVGNPFSATLSCGQSGTRETGNATTNPFTCTVGYANGTTASATLTDGTNTTTLSSPYTSGSLAFVYSSNTTFTLHATATNTQTATATNSLSFVPRVFDGVGHPGATSATASENTAVLSTSDVLASPGVGLQSSYGPFNPSNQSIYLLITSGSCTFTSGGFQFPMNTPISVSFVNQFGVTVSMFLYQSTNLLSAPFTLVPTC